MTGRGVAIQGGLAALGLVVAYTTWQREPERAAGEVVVVDSTKTELGNVHYEDDNVSVDIRKREEGGETGPWLRVEDKTPAPAPKPPTPPTPTAPATTAPATKTPPPPPAKTHPPRELRGDDPAEKLLAQFAPFRSPRAFGALDAKKAKELGLEDAKKKLVLTARGEKHEFVIGQPAQGGESYLRETLSGKVYLMPRALLTDLQGAAHRLVDRKLHTFKIADVATVTVAAGGKTRAFVVKDGQNPTAYKLAPASAADKPDEMARNWHEKVWRLFPSEILGKGETPTGGEPTVVARVDYADKSKRIGWIEIGKVDLPPPDAPASVSTAAPPQNRTELYGRSEHTAGWMKLPSDPGTVTDAEKIAAGS